MNPMKTTTDLYRHIEAALEAATAEKEAAGRSDRGRCALILLTKLEQVAALTEYYGLDEVVPELFPQK